MTTSVLQFGTQIALDIRDSSANGTAETRNLKTLGDLLDILGENPPRAFPMLRTTCSLLMAYLSLPAEQILIDSVYLSRDGFRPFLEGRKNAENSIRTYVNHVRILLKSAKEFGWKPDESVPEAWRDVLALASTRQCIGVVKSLARIRKTPRDVTIEDVDRWGQMRVKQGVSHTHVVTKKTWFWRLLRDGGFTKQTPKCLLRESYYGIPIEQFPPNLMSEVIELLRWKQATYAVDRPKEGRHRAVTAKTLRQVIRGLFGYSVNIRKEAHISALAQLVQKPIVSGYVEWCINEREVKGQTLRHCLGMLLAALRHHPMHVSMDLSWFRPLLDSIPVEHDSQIKLRKAEKYLEYKVVENIPAQIRAQRRAAEKRGIEHVASLVMRELLMKWLITLPWRQRNIRECRVGGPTPNLFKGIIPPFSDIDKPEWVIQEERKNPGAQFWQFRFSVDETKTGIEVNSLLPRQLIGILEEYLKDFRIHLFKDSDPETLFINRTGTPMTINQMTQTVSQLTNRYGGRRVTPHPFRDIVAFTWLKEHPKDYLTLSKMLWHSNINTTIKIYGSRFNESSGVSAMESWLDKREAESK